MRSRVLFLAALAALGVAIPAAAGEIRGRVLVDGKPAVGVAVRLLPFEDGPTSARREARREPGPVPVGETTTRPDGTFAVATGTAAVGAVRVGFSGAAVAAMLLQDVVEGSGAELGDVALPKAAVLAGRVVDGRGGPVLGATVTLRAGTGERFRSGTLEAVPQVATTKADGSFRFETAAAEDNSLNVEAAAFAIVERRGVHAGALLQPLLLDLGRSRRGTVTLADHRTPAAGALVRFEGRAQTRWTEAGKDGTFVLDGVPRESGTLVADGGDKGRAALPVAARVGEAVTLTLVPTAQIAGRVVEAVGAKPLGGVRVVARGDSGAPFLARSGPDGRYAIRGLPPHRYRITVDDDRFVPWARSVTVSSGEAQAQDVALLRGAALSGRVFNEDGAPVEGAVIRVVHGGTNPFRAFMRAMESEDRVRSARDGSFRATRLAPGENQRLDVSHEDYEEQAVGGLSLPAGATRSGVNVVLRHGLALRGVVKDGDGRPLAGVEVTLARARAFSTRRGDVQMSMIGPGSQVRRETGNDGRFQFHGLKPGDYALAARKQGFGRASLDPVAVAEASVGEPVELRLQPGASISGTLHDRTGGGVAGWYVAARPAGEPGGGPPLGPGALRTEDATGPDGAFVLESLAQGQSYDLQLMGPSGLGPRRVAVMAPADGLDITVTGLGEIRGRVIDADSGRPVPDFDVRYEPDAQGGMRFVMRFGRGDDRGPYQRRPFHAEDGGFALEDVPAGRWTVQASASGYQEGAASGVAVEEGGVTDDVEVRLAKGGTISGRVLDKGTGQPVLDASVRAEPSGGGGGGMRMVRIGGEGEGNESPSDSDGRYQLTGLAPGRWTVTASHPDWSEAAVSVDLKDAPATADIRLGRGGWIAGTVLAAGRAVAGAEVALSAGGDGGFRGFDRSEQGTLSDESGRFRFERLAPGRYQVAATLRQQSSAPAEAVVTGEDGQDVALVLLQGAVIRGTVSGLPEAQLSGVSVNAQGQDYAASARTAAGGGFELSGAPEGAITLRATAGDFASSSRSASTNITIAPGETDVFAEIAFPAGFRVEGHVTRGGRPVADAIVVAAPESGRTRTATGRSEEDGAYVLEGLEEGTYTLMANAQGSPPIRRTVAISGDTTVDLEAPPARLAGTVVDAESGRPLGDVAVRIDDESGGGGMRFLTIVDTDSAGRFAFEDVEPRSYRLSFQKPAYQVETRTLEASVDADTRVELRRGEGIALEARDALYATPLRGLMVRVLDNAGGSVFSGSVSLDSDGRGEIPSLKPGVYELRAEASGYAPVSLPGVAVPQTTLVLALSPGGSLEIHAGPETLALSDPAGRLVGSDGRVYVPGVFSDGKIRLFGPLRRLDNVVPGRYSFEVAGGARRDVTIVEGGAASVTLP